MGLFTVTFVSLFLVLPTAFSSDLPTKGASPSSKKSTKQKYENLELFQKVLQFVEENYVEDVGNQQLIHGAVKGMLDSLDPHSAFLPSEVFRDLKNDTAGKFGGVGLEVGVRDEALVVITPIEDSPAWRAGILPGDRIVRVEGVMTKGLNSVEVLQKMRGKTGTDLRLGIMRDGWDQPKEFKLRREEIKLQTVKQEVLEPGFGYLRLTHFNEDAAKDLKRGLEKIEKSGKLKGLVLDLRMNPGGLLDQAVEVASLFMDDGIVVSTIGRDPAKKETRMAKKGMARKDFLLAVLVNGGSASASEIVAGALQDRKRAIVMGQTTFGKGSVQTVVDLGNEMGLKLTIARYFTPSGRSIQETGVEPDVLLEDYDTKLLAQAKRAGPTTREKDLRGHMVNPSQKKSDGSDDLTAQKLDYSPKADYQVQQAVNTLKSFEFFQRIANVSEK
jgi:carboxyl-terminal processing protease